MKKHTLTLIVAMVLLISLSSQAQPVQGRSVIQDSILVYPTVFNLDLQQAVKNPGLTNDPFFQDWVKSFKGNLDSVVAHIGDVFVAVRYANKPEDQQSKQEFARLYLPQTGLFLYGWESKYWVPMIRNQYVYTSQPISLRSEWTYVYKFVIRADNSTERWINDPSNKTPLEGVSGSRNSVVEVK